MNSVNNKNLPFPLLFAEEVPPQYLAPIPSYDITLKIAKLIGRNQPDGRHDKILILTNSRDPHADNVAIELCRRGAKVCRFNTDDFPTVSKLSISLGDPNRPLGILQLPSGNVSLDEVKSVWFRRPEIALNNPNLSGEGIDDFIYRESEAAFRGFFAALDKAFWISHPNAIKASDNKLDQLKVAQSLGLLIPKTLVTNDPKLARDFHKSCKGNMIVKTFRGWSGSISSKIYSVLTNRVLSRHLENLSLVKYSPCLFQEYVPKDVELRVTIIGRRVFAAEIHSQNSTLSQDDWRRYDFQNTPYYSCKLPSKVENSCSRLLDHYGLAFGAIDMIRRPDGEYVFLELNANGQWLWIQRLTGMPLIETISDMLIKGSID